MLSLFSTLNAYEPREHAAKRLEMRVLACRLAQAARSSQPSRALEAGPVSGRRFVMAVTYSCDYSHGPLRARRLSWYPDREDHDGGAQEVLAAEGSGGDDLRSPPAVRPRNGHFPERLRRAAVPERARPRLRDMETDDARRRSLHQSQAAGSAPPGRRSPIRGPSRLRP